MAVGLYPFWKERNRNDHECICSPNTVHLADILNTDYLRCHGIPVGILILHCWFSFPFSFQICLILTARAPGKDKEGQVRTI